MLKLLFRSFAFAALLVAGGPHAAPASGAVKTRVEIKNVKVAESLAGKLSLDVSWSYVEQDVKAKEISIIAILIGARGKEYRAALTVPAPRSGARPSTSRVVINHEEQIVGGPPARVKVTIGSGITDGTSNTFAPATKELEVKLAP